MFKRNCLKLIKCPQNQRFLSSLSEGSALKIFSGVQPTGQIHLGNYFGAIKNWTRLQNQHQDVMFCIADNHSMTLAHNPRILYSNIIELTATLLACGIDTSRSLLFQQSRVHQHTELCWHLACLTTMARLAHLPQYKEKSATLKDIPTGLFMYPVLQAADVLVYKSTHVPVGEDQSQQIQLAQTLARMFNQRYGHTFPPPHCILDEHSAKIRSLRNPAKKMSKSDPDILSKILLTDPPEEILRKFKKALTDFTSAVTYEPEHRPGVSNLVLIHSACTGKPIKQIIEESEGLSTAQYKVVVAEATIDLVLPIQKTMKELMKDPFYLETVLIEGSNKAANIAETTMREVRTKLGIRSEYDRNAVEKHFII